jgi:LPXTG-site transpeptidase (sortase) family protein
MKLSSLFIRIAIISAIITGVLYYEQVNPKRLEFSHVTRTDTQQDITQIESLPAGLIIDRVDIWVPLIPSTIQSGQWETTAKGVSYAKNYTIPGQKGNAILYGHNWSNILGNLYKVKPGDEIQIVYTNSVKKVFEVQTTQEVSPTDVSILNNTEDARITLYTCSGFLDTKRFVVVATLKAVIEVPSPQGGA